MRTTALALMLMCSGHALSNDFSVALGGWSHHVDGDGITNEVHDIVALEAHDWSAGYFKNSYGRDTVFIAHTWRTEIAKHIEVSATLGINRGYRECFGDTGSEARFCPHGYFGFAYTKYMFVPTIKVIPGIDDQVIVFSPEIRF